MSCMVSETQESPEPRGKGKGQHDMVNVSYLDRAERRQSSSKQSRGKLNSGFVWIEIPPF